MVLYAMWTDPLQQKRLVWSLLVILVLLSLWQTNVIRTWLQLITKLEISGQYTLTFCKNTLPLRLLKAFVALIWSNVAELSLSNKSTMLRVADSTPATWPAQTCNEPAACTTSFFKTDIIALRWFLVILSLF